MFKQDGTFYLKKTGEIVFTKFCVEKKTNYQCLRNRKRTNVRTINFLLVLSLPVFVPISQVVNLP